MAHQAKKTEHAGPKKGKGAYWGRKVAAKKESNRQRREMDKESIMSEITPENNVNVIYQQIRDMLIQARSRAWQAVNTAMVTVYWNVGRLIVEDEQRGEARADYGKRLIPELSKRLTAEFGKGFDKSNIWNMRAFYLTYPKIDAVRRELSWTHYRLLLRVEKPEARAFYEAEAVNARWSTRELDRQINSLLFERLALSRDKSGVRELAAKGHEIHDPVDLVKDPYVLIKVRKQSNLCLPLQTVPADRRRAGSRIG